MKRRRKERILFFFLTFSLTGQTSLPASAWPAAAAAVDWLVGSSNNSNKRILNNSNFVNYICMHFNKIEEAWCCWWWWWRRLSRWRIKCERNADALKWIYIYLEREKERRNISSSLVVYLKTKRECIFRFVILLSHLRVKLYVRTFVGIVHGGNNNNI